MIKIFLENSAYAAFAVFIICCTGVLLHLSGLGAFAADLFISTITALATATAAWMAARSAKAARDSANQWKEQKHYDRELDAIIEVLISFSEWRNTLHQIRQHAGSTPIKVARGTEAGRGYCRGLNSLGLPDYLNKHLRTSTRLRTAIDQARILGTYEDIVVKQVQQLDGQFTSALQRLNSLNSDTSSFQDSDVGHINVLRQRRTDDSFGNSLQGTSMNFERCYQGLLNKKKNKVPA